MPASKSISFVTCLSIGLVAGSYLAILHSDGEQIRAYVASRGVLAPLVFLLLKISTHVIAPLGNTPYFLAAEPLFGRLWGFVLLFVGGLIGHTTCFLIARACIPDPTLLPSALMSGSIRGGERQKSFLAALIYGRAVLFGLQDLVSYAAGFTAISFPEYFTVTAIATGGHTVVGMTLGRGFMQSSPVFLAIYSVLTILVLPTFWLSHQRRRSRRVF